MEGRWLDDAGLEPPRDAVPTPKSDRLGRLFLWIGGGWLILTLAVSGWITLAGVGALLSIWLVSMYRESNALRTVGRSGPRKDAQAPPV